MIGPRALRLTRPANGTRVAKFRESKLYPSAVSL